MTQLFKPNDLQEAACIVLGFEGCSEAAKTCASADDFATKYHHSVGRTIRNEMGLWLGAGACPVDEAPLFYWFYRHGLRHPDDMSTIVLKAVWCDQNNQSLDIDEEVKFYQTYWSDYWKSQWNRVTEAVDRLLEKY